MVGFYWKQSRRGKIFFSVSLCSNEKPIKKSISCEKPLLIG